MEIRGVDPRDTRWEVERPTFRCYFWNKGGGRHHVDAGTISDEYEIRCDDVREVLVWAEEFAVLVNHLLGEP